MNTMIAAVVAALLLLWGGIAGLLRTVDLFERKHMLFLGGYCTLVAGSVLALVLYISAERQRAHRQDLQAQMEAFAGRLNQLSESLIQQLDEKAQLTASEFEIRVKLQNEIRHHARTREELDAKFQAYNELKRTLDQELESHRHYRAGIEQRLQERFEQEEARYRDLHDNLQAQRRLLQNTHQQIGAAQEDLARIKTQTAGIQQTQTNLLATVNSHVEVFGNRTQELANKLDALIASQAESHEAISVVKSQVDSLYQWEAQ